MTETHPGRDAWERFWTDAPDGAEAVFWDTDPRLAAALHLPLLAPYFAPGLPLIDLGCGNGTQSAFLARHYEPVIGVDVSATAVARARAEHCGTQGAGPWRSRDDAWEAAGRPRPAAREGALPQRSLTDRSLTGRALTDRILTDRAPVEGTSAEGTLTEEVRIGFRQFDATDQEEARRLHAELGDANVYVRGVLHQCGPHDRTSIARTIAELVGDRGRAFVVEPAGAAKDVVMGLVRRTEGPPPSLALVLKCGIAPAEMPDEAIPGLFPTVGLKVVAGGRLPLITTEFGPDGARVEMPSNWLVAGRGDGPGQGADDASAVGLLRDGANA